MKKNGKRIIRTVALSLAGVVLVTVIAAGIILYGRIASMLSIRKIGDGIYTMNFHQNYHLDKALAAGIKNEEELFEFVCDDMYFGYQTDGNLSQYSCSAFLTPSPDGSFLAGRNFDLSGTGTLCLYTHPKGGYASVSTVLTDFVGVGEENGLDATSFFGRASLLTAPYLGVDGMNEKGLTAALLDTDRHSETHMDTEAPELTVTMAIRLLLDRAATVEEALALLEQYDIHTSHGWSQHIFLADASGEAAIAEWYNNDNNKMKVVRYPVCTNFRMSEPWLNGVYTDQCDRFDLLDQALREKDAYSAEDSMKLLESVKQNHTIWSVVFHLNGFTADYVVNQDYGQIYRLDPRDF